MAMDWVRVCISSFGGDPNSVTLQGYSSGAASIGLQLLSPVPHWIQGQQTRKLLLQSGSPLEPFKGDTLSLRDQVAALLVELGCKSDMREAKRCMRTVYVDRLLRPSLHTRHVFGPRFETSFLPCVDAEGFPLPDAATNNKLILLGNVRGEGIVLYEMIRRLYTEATDPTAMWPDVRNELFEYGIRNIDTMWHLYSSGDDSIKDGNETGDDHSERVALTQMLGDVFYVCPLQYFAQALSAKGHSVFAYLFTAKPSNSPWTRERWPAQYEDLPFFLGSYLTQTAQVWERSLSATLMELLAGFTHHGTLPTLDNGTAWPAYSEQNPAIVEIGSSGLQILADGHRDNACRRLRYHLLTDPDNIFTSARCHLRK
ncbi:hypothetical protein MTO96_035586 [Rhipicephalus appendiculatus]